MPPVRLSLWLSTAIFAVLAAAFLFGFSHLLWHQDARELIPEKALVQLPGMFYLFGLWACRRAAKRLATGEHFAPATRRLLRQVGLALILGTAMETFGVPWLRLLLEGGPGPVASFDPATLTLAAVGVMMIVLSGLWRRAGEMDKELGEFF